MDATIHPWLMRWLRAPQEAEVPSAADTWDLILRQARTHGLIPLLNRESHRFPEERRETLRREAARTAANNLLLTEELRAILEAARARAIACMPVRGVALGEQLYGSAALRPTGDIDLLVRRDEIAAVRTMLVHLGFHEVEVRRSFALDFYYTLEFFKERHFTIIVEPHWSLAYTPFTDRLQWDDVRSRCVEGRVAGLSTWLLGPEDLLIHLCLHVVHHRRDAPMLWFYDMDRLIRSGSINWPRLLQIIQDSHLGPLIHPILSDVQATCQTPIPEEILERLDHVPSGLPEGRILSFLRRAPTLRGREKIAMLMHLPGLRQKARYALSFLVPSPEFVRVQYGVSNRWQVSLTYIGRLGDLCWAGLQGVWRLLHR